ncbi:hypothetical protein M3Y94_00167600 [Aphelenchoides besseyi]|nr:hypothetical protein M3Y94_00167600 [Aphelenchoides besseyi]KAI6237009.1 Acylpyruvase FAHD1, mitochondrial-like protein [Aphelenchoides besseyi]
MSDNKDSVIDSKDVKSSARQVVGFLNNFPSWTTTNETEPPIEDNNLVLFRKDSKNLITPGDQVKIPVGHQGVIAEIHLGVVVGDEIKASHDSLEDIVDRVAGFVICYTFRLRDRNYQVGSRVFAETFEFPSNVAISEVIPRSLIERPDGCVIWSNVNEKEVQRAPLSELRTAILQMIPQVNKFAPLNKGDIVLSGSPSGGYYVKQGDALEGGIEDVARVEFIVEKMDEHVPKIVDDPRASE